MAKRYVPIISANIIIVALYNWTNLVNSWNVK